MSKSPKLKISDLKTKIFSLWRAHDLQARPRGAPCLAQIATGASSAFTGCMDSAELLARAERFALASLTFYRRVSKSTEAQVRGVQFYEAATSSSRITAPQRRRSRPISYLNSPFRLRKSMQGGRLACVHGKRVNRFRPSAASRGDRTLRHPDRLSQDSQAHFGMRNSHDASNSRQPASRIQRARIPDARLQILDFSF